MDQSKTAHPISYQSLTMTCRLHESWLAALDQAQTHFKSLLTGSSSTEWKRVTVPGPSSSIDSQSSSSAQLPHVKLSRPRVSDVSVHRRTTKTGDVLRVSLEIPAEDTLESIDAWKAVLTTPEMRKEWDPTVESSSIVETVFGPETRLARTEFSLGWPAKYGSPTISTRDKCSHSAS